MNEREQRVVIKDASSSFTTILGGVPPRISSWPFAVYNIYINDIADKLTSLTRLFADDTSFNCSHSDGTEIQSIINHDLKELDEWFKRWLRDRPFNLKGGLWFFVSFKKNFSDNMRVRIFIFFVARSVKYFFQYSTLAYMTKTLNQIIFFFLHQNQNIFFSNIGNQNICFGKKTITPPSS